MPNSKLTPFLILQFCVALLILALSLSRSGMWSALQWAGFLIALFAAIPLFVARYQLGKSFSVTPQARELVTHGIYSKIRNPIYVFSTLFVMGLLIAFQIPKLFLVLALLVAAQAIRARKEAQVLEAKFGDAYREYRKETWF